MSKSLENIDKLRLPLKRFETDALTPGLILKPALASTHPVTPFIPVVWVVLVSVLL